MPLSYDAVVTNRIHQKVFEDVVPGALEDFDLPDLVSAIAPRRVWISGPVAPAGPEASMRELQESYSSAVKVFGMAEAPDGIRLLPARRDGEDAARYYRDLLTSR